MNRLTLIARISALSALVALSGCSESPKDTPLEAQQRRTGPQIELTDNVGCKWRLDALSSYVFRQIKPDGSPDCPAPTPPAPIPPRVVVLPR